MLFVLLVLRLVVLFDSSSGQLLPSEVRLVDGPTPYSGRVEVRYNGSWGTICDDMFDTADVTVVCRMLGYGIRNVQAYSLAAFGRGNGSIIIDDLQCVGNESTLFDCPSRPWLTNNCRHGEDAGVDCRKVSLSTSDIRLEGGSAPHAGRVEVMVNGSWGTICADRFDRSAAVVICRMLGYEPGHVQALWMNDPMQAGEYVTIPDLQCSGRESSLSDCSYAKPWTPYTNTCGQSWDAGVDCNLTIGASEIRLTDGPFPDSGRVEVFYNGSWGSVCGSGFDQQEALVVCRTLGYSTQHVKWFSSAEFGPGTGLVYGYHLQCQGTEATLSNCRSTAWTSPYCKRGLEAGVECHNSSLSDSDVRLVNGTSPYSGRVEVYYNGTWGTVCDDGFGDNDARVVCRMLDYGSQYVQWYRETGYTQGRGPVVISNLQCSGTERSLSDCLSSPWLTPERRCDHSMDVGVNCLLPISSGGIRLVNGISRYSGRVELFYNGSWGTICDNAFDNNDAQVICRMLGYSTQHVQPFRSAAFGEGSGRVIYDYLRCYGSERTLTDCMSNPWMSHMTSCGHSRDAGVDCQLNISRSDVRLVNGTRSAGRVEVLYNGTWGALCGRDFDKSAATVICRMLGFGTGHVQAFNGGGFEGGSGPIYGYNLQCRGDETSISGCRSSEWNSQYCHHDQDAGVDCRKLPLSRSHIRLVDGHLPSSGRVEVFYNGSWGTVCDNGFDDNDAKVVCRLLGFGTEYVRAFRGAVFGQGIGPISVDNLQCDGNEATLSDCRSNPWPSREVNCNHTMDASIDCHCDIRLMDGPSNDSGRVEVFYNGSWGTVCDDGFDVHDAFVICHMLGYDTKNVRWFPSAVFGQGDGPVFLDNMQCDGTESTISDCRSSVWPTNDRRCGHDRDAAVDCQFVLSPHDVRLVGGASPDTGRVEVFYNGTWGTVCDTGFDVNDARVVCRMLGYSTQHVQNIGASTSGQGSGPIAVDNLQCIGNETTLSDCRSSPWLTHNRLCNHSRDANIACKHMLRASELRLVDGPSLYSGRVEVFFNDHWGTICDDSFDDNDATVICRMLGHVNRHVHAYGGATFGRGNGSIVIDELRCQGNETTLSDCNSSPWLTNDCWHGEDAGVDCRYDITTAPISVSPVTPSTSTVTSTLRSATTADNYAATGCAGNWIPWPGNSAYTVTWATTSRNDVTFTMTGPVTDRQWMGLGLSHNDRMDNSDIYITRRAGNSWVVEDRYATGYSAPNVDAHRDVTNATFTENSGVLTVTFTRAILTDDENDVNFTNCLYLLFAYGSSVGGSVQYHTQNRAVSQHQFCIRTCDIPATPMSSVTTSTSAGASTIRSATAAATIQPHASTGCAGNWIPWPGNSAYTVTWVTTIRNDVTFTMTGPVTDRQWMGLGLSDNDRMDNSDIYIARTAGNSCVVEDRYATGYASPKVDAHQDVTNATCIETNGVLTVTFTRAILTDDDNDMNVTDCLYLLFAYGSSAGGSVQYHTQNRVVSQHQFCIRTCDTGLQVGNSIHPGCTDSTWNVSLDMRTLHLIYPSAVATDIYFGESSCRGVNYGGQNGTLYFHPGLMDCLTNKQATGNTTVYSNELVYAQHDSVRPYMIRHYKWTVPVQCVVDVNGIVSGHLNTDVSNSTGVGLIANSSDYSAHMLFYHDPNYHQQMSGNPLYVGVGTFVYVKVYTPLSDWDVTMRVHTCYTLPTASSPKSMKYYLIKNGCEVDSNTHITAQTTHETRLVFQNFESSAKQLGLYVFCDATFCQTNDSSRHCTETCNPVVQ